MEEGVHSSMADNIMTITINRPESRNSLDMVAVRAASFPAGWGEAGGVGVGGLACLTGAGLFVRRLFSP